MNRNENILLLSCLIYQDKLLQEAVTKAGDHPLFNNMVEPHANFIWSVLRDCYNQTGTHPTPAFIETETDSRLQNLMGLEEGFKQTTMQILSTAIGFGAANTSYEIGNMYLETAISETFMTDWVSNLSSLGSLEEMKEYVNGISADMAVLSSSGDARVKPLQTPEKFLVHKERHEFGVRVLDLITGKGLADGEILGLLGPTGGGKTVFAVGMLCEGALRHKHTILASYEQPTEGDIMERICAYITGEPIDKFRDKEMQDLPQDLQDRIKEATDKYGEYITFLDLSSGGKGAGGADELITEIDKQIERGEKPRLLVIDWLGAMVQRYLAETGTDSSAYRHIAHQFIDRIRVHAQTHGYSVVITHQLSTQKARASVYSKPNATDAFEFKAFSYYMDGCVCLGTLDPETRVGWLCIDKFRRGAVNDLMIRLDGAHVRFEMASGYTTDHRGRFIEKDAAPPDIDDDMYTAAQDPIAEDLQQAFPV